MAVKSSDASSCCCMRIVDTVSFHARSTRSMETRSEKLHVTTTFHRPPRVDQQASIITVFISISASTHSRFPLPIQVSARTFSALMPPLALDIVYKRFIEFLDLFSVRPELEIVFYAPGGCSARSLE